MRCGILRRILHGSVLLSFDAYRTLKILLRCSTLFKVEGQFAGRYGFIVLVQNIVEPFPVGAIDDDTGFAVFPLKYQALVFRPFRGQVLDSVVTKVSKLGHSSIREIYYFSLIRRDRKVW